LQIRLNFTGCLLSSKNAFPVLRKVVLKTPRKKSVAPATLKKLIGQKRPEFAGGSTGKQRVTGWSLN